MYEYLLSVIMPIYNSAPYLCEAIESILAQSLGFEKIQLILVNDGSSDQSADIIKSYAEKHENIVFIDKENGGVSSARNAGLEYVKGKYITFPDPDDVLSLNAYEDAIGFFEKNYELTDVVSFPIDFFGDANGEHPLNGKFNRGERIINLIDENEFQLHITSSIIKSECKEKIRFKTELDVSEDAEVLLRLLIDTPRLGVVPSARYRYRKRQGSLLTEAPQKSGYYLPHMEHYFKSVIDSAIAKYGTLPEFIQSALVYELSWKLSISKAPSVLTAAQISELETQIFECFSKIDAKIIEQSSLPKSTVQYVLLKTGREVSAEKYPYTLEFIETREGKTEITARVECPSLEDVPRSLSAYVNGTEIKAEAIGEVKSKLFGKPMALSATATFSIDKRELENGATVYFSHSLIESDGVSQGVTLGKHFPLEQKYKNVYSLEDNLLISFDGDALVFEAASKKRIKKCEKAFRRELWKSNAFAERKAVIARILATLYKKLHKKPIWIISDRLSTAKDNAEALFEHLAKTRFSSAKYVFAINKGEDFDRLKKIGKVIDRASLWYKIIHLCADMIISSHAEDFVTNPFDYYSAPYKDILAKKKFVFLQHGVTKDDLSSWLNKFNKNIKGFICSSRAEYNSILHTYPYHYNEEELWLTGMPRFDKLKSSTERQIVLMPTWRRYLTSDIDISTGKWGKSSALENSDYTLFWKGFVESGRLQEALEKHGYNLVLVPHPNLDISPFIHTSPRVRVEKSPCYADVYEKSACLVTDYSSVAFDMAYLGKPVIYAQPDRERFFSGEHTYGAGYYDYEKNGFGKVANTLDEAVSLVIQCIENECAPDQVYLDRIDEFFEYRDRGACARVVKKLLELGETK